MRPDGRAPDELRAIKIERKFTKYAEGSVLVSFGETKVLCTATVEQSVPRFLRDSGRGWITAEYAMLPRSTHERIRRDASTRGRALEISRLIGRSLRASVHLERLGERQIIVDCDVLQADGGTRTAAITGGYVALCDALEYLVEKKCLGKAPLVGECAAVSVGVVEGEVLLDLCYEEDSQAEVDMNLVMMNDGRYVEVQGSAEGKAFPREVLDEMLRAGERGIESLIARQREALGRG